MQDKEIAAAAHQSARYETIKNDPVKYGEYLMRRKLERKERQRQLRDLERVKQTNLQIQKAKRAEAYKRLSESESTAEAGKRTAKKKWPAGMRADLKEWRVRQCLTIRQLSKKLGIPPEQIAGSEDGTTDIDARYLAAAKLKKPTGRYIRRYCKVSSICIDCRECTCDWLHEHLPVRGWIAEKTTVNRGHTESYAVRACPLYRE
jgi:hypothetical protein